jgi:hypothetical protein
MLFLRPSKSVRTAVSWALVGGAAVKKVETPGPPGQLDHATRMREIWTMCPPPSVYLSHGQPVLV